MGATGKVAGLQRLARWKHVVNIVLLLGAAAVVPGVGQRLQEVVPVKAIAVTVIFLVTGLVLETGNILDQARNLRLHAVCQGMTFLVFPLLVAVTHHPLDSCADGQLTVGLFALACVPTTISSCVVFTTLAGGNTAGALFNAVLGNMAGIVVSPVVFMLLLRGQRVVIDLDEAAFALRLARLVVVPFAVGQLLRFWPAVRHAVTARRPLCRQINTAAILLIMYLAFCSLFGRAWPGLGGPSVAALIVYLVLLHATVLALLVGACRVSGLTASDRVAALFAGSQKTLALGLPVIMAFAEQSPLISADLAVLPLVLYHSLQLIVASVLRERMT